MRIVQVASYFPPPYGGIESHVYYLSRELVRLGHEVTVLTSRSLGQGSIKEEVRDGVLVKRLWTPFSFFNFPFMPALLYRILREEADVLHGHINSPMVVEPAAAGSWLRQTSQSEISCRRKRAAGFGTMCSSACCGLFAK